MRTLAISRLAWVVIVAAPALAAQKGKKDEGPPPIFSVMVEGKFGFINREGEIVIEPAFYNIGRLGDGLIPVQPEKDGPYGYMDCAGKMVIEPQFTFAREFSSGLAWVGMGDGLNASMQVLNGKWGVIDKSGRFTIRPTYRWPGIPFFRGMSIVPSARAPLGKSVIDGRGRPLRELSYTTDVQPFSDGMARYGRMVLPKEVRPGQYSGGHTDWGYLDSRFKPVGSAIFDRAGDFSEGLAGVRSRGSEKFAYIDKRCRFVMKAQFEQAEPFAEGLAAVMLTRRKRNNDRHSPAKWGYIDKRRRLAFEPFEATHAGPFSKGHAAVFLTREREGPPPHARSTVSPAHIKVIDRQGNSIFEHKKCYIDPFENGLAKVRICVREWRLPDVGYIDGTGKYVWEPQH
jgi:hypothetical protein